MIIRQLVGPAMALVVGLAVILLAGCAVGPGGHGPSPATQKVLLQQGIGLAVDHFLVDSPKTQERVARVRGVAERLANVTGVTTVTDLRAAVDAEVKKLNLSVLEQKDAQRFLEIMEAVLRDYVGGEQLDAQGLVKVNDVVQWILVALPLAPVPTTVER